MDSTMPLENWLTAEEAAKKIGCTADHVRLLARNGELAAKRLAGRWIFAVDAVQAFAAKPQQTGRPKKFQKQC